MAENGIPAGWGNDKVEELQRSFAQLSPGSAASSGLTGGLEGLQNTLNNFQSGNTTTTTVTLPPQGNDKYASTETPGSDLDKLQQSLRGFSGTGNTSSRTSSGTSSVSSSSSDSSPNGNKVVSKALEWVGKDFRPGEREQCANFVNDVLGSAGIKTASTNKPIDGLPTGESMASHFFGEDVGSIIKDKNQLQVGDLVSWGGTYGGYSKDTITHVGIYVGNGEVVDRSTSAGPVQRRKIESIGDFLAGVRPFAYSKS